MIATVNATAIGLLVAAGTLELSNKFMSATVSSAGDLVGIVANVPGASPHNFTNDSWAVELSDFNATTNGVLLSSTTCAAPTVTASSPSDATFRYACDGGAWRIEVTYALPAGGKHIVKGLSVTTSIAAPWTGTIRALELWRGLALTGSDEAYVGNFVSMMPYKTDFHPSNSSKNKPTHGGYGVVAEWLGSFYRRPASSDGLLVAIANPFGIYTPPAPAPGSDSASAFDYRAGCTCSTSKYAFINNQTAASCETACAADAQCVEFKLKLTAPFWCTLTNASGASPPRTAPGYGCGCKGSCPGPSPGPGPAPGPGPLPNTSIPIKAVIYARYVPLFQQTKKHAAVYVAEPALLALTALERYAIDSANGVNLGEARAYQDLVSGLLLDKPSATSPEGKRQPVRVQVGWDSNDYQLDIGTAAGRMEYKRMIARDGELGITHAIFAPQNSKESSRYAPVESVDAWGWEESLWFSMGEKIRRGEWSPGNASDAVPTELQEMLDYAESHGVKLLAYVYPVLPFIHAGAEPRNGENGEGWLFDGVRDTKTGAYKPNFNNNNKPGQPVIPNCTEPGTAPYSRCQDTRASLSNVEWQDYLAQTLIDFVTKTGAGGFAYDYTAFRDWRPKTDYDAWRGWTRILAKLRAAHPDIVMDHRQSNHQWGAWSQAAGSYSEPIAGDENPESYGSKGVSGVTTLSTDHVLANNLRVVNSVYRGRQLLPNSRIPGFMSHQTERSFDDGEGPGTKPFWNVTGHYQRDFDFAGFKYSLMSSIGTAGLNNVVAMLPARDLAEYNALPNATTSSATPRGATIPWIKRWLDWTEEEFMCLHNTIPLVALDRGVGGNGGIPQLGALDGTGSFLDDDSRGFLFLFNPGPRPVCSTLYVDEGMGISNASAGTSFIVHEIYPREEINGRKTPIGVWEHGAAVQVCVAAESNAVLRATKLSTGAGDGSLAAMLPLLLNLSYTKATQSTFPSGKAELTMLRVTVEGAMDLSGADVQSTVLAALSAGANSSTERLSSVVINGHLADLKGEKSFCLPYQHSLEGVACAPARIKMAGSAVLRAFGEATTTSPPHSFRGGVDAWFNATLVLSADMKALMASQQKEYNVPWVAKDMDAPWLGNRLKLFPYITQPDVNLTIPRLWIDGKEVALTKAFNSRGHLEAKCFLGWYWDASTVLAVGTHDVSVQMPTLNNSAGSARLEGLFWSGMSDVYTTDVDPVATPLAGGDLRTCAAGPAKGTPLPPAAAKNVLYILVDDLRPELSPYNQTNMHTPNIEKFAASATLFTNAYCNVAVCSPSRMSFLSGRRPLSTHIYNFVNHIRQATCPAAESATRWIGQKGSLTGYRNVTIDKTQGAAGECCSQCTSDDACDAWTYFGASVSDGGAFADSGAKLPDYCTLFASRKGGRAAAAHAGVISGLSGSFLKLTAMPEHFRESGYLALQSGKVWHTEEGNLYGLGMPPNQDAGRSWSDGCSMANVNELAVMAGCDKVPGTQGCPIDATANGIVAEPTKFAPLCDQVIADDAVAKLRIAASMLNKTGRPFFLASGFRKPHMPWRFPKPYAANYPAAADIVIAKHPVMDASVPPIAHHTPDLSSMNGGDPYVPMAKTLAQHDRLYYYGSVSWTDSRVGLVLDELDALGLTPTTLVVMHSDHGWALGEHGQWQKFNNWEVGVRVPLLIRAPWLGAAAAGRRTNTLAELVDIYPTMVDLAGIVPPKGDTLPLDGTSLAWALRAAGRSELADASAGNGKDAVLSIFARCPLETDQTTWITNVTEMWKNNWCEFVDRSAIPWMGFSMRTGEWRYTEWAQWNGSKLAPNWAVNAGVELYDHRGVDASGVNNDFDATENESVAKDNPSVVAQLAKQLHALVAAQTAAKLTL